MISGVAAFSVNLSRRGHAVVITASNTAARTSAKITDRRRHRMLIVLQEIIQFQR